MNPRSTVRLIVAVVILLMGGVAIYLTRFQPSAGPVAQDVPEASVVAKREVDQAANPVPVDQSRLAGLLGKKNGFGYLRPRARAPLTSEGRVAPAGAPGSPSPVDPVAAATELLRRKGLKDGHDLADFEGLTVTDRVFTARTGVTHVYLRQSYQGIEVYNGDANANVAKDGTILSLHQRFVPKLASEINRTEPLLSAEEAVRAAARNLGVVADTPLADRKSVV